MRNYAPEKLELAPRDVVSRSMITEIQAGRGFKHAQVLIVLNWI